MGKRPVKESVLESVLLPKRAFALRVIVRSCGRSRWKHTVFYTLYAGFGGHSERRISQKDGFQTFQIYRSRIPPLFPTLNNERSSEEVPRVLFGSDTQGIQLLAIRDLEPTEIDETSLSNLDQFQMTAVLNREGLVCAQF